MDEINTKKIPMMIIGGLLLVFFISISESVRNTPFVWMETRVFGLLAYFSLFATILLGELRMLWKEHGGFGLFKYHKPIAIFSASLVVAHFITAVADNFKWGKQLAFTQYLGFSFSNKWLILLSLGTLAAYLMVITALTSSPKIIQKMGFNRWKIAHYVGYGAFIVAYIHSTGLGTDVKTSALSPYLHPVIVVSFFLVIALLITRVISVKNVFSDVIEKHLATAFFVLLLVGSVFAVSGLKDKQDRMGEIASNIAKNEEEIGTNQEKIDKLSQEIEQMEDAKYNTQEAVMKVNELREQSKQYENRIQQLSNEITGMRAELEKIKPVPPPEPEVKEVIKYVPISTPTPNVAPVPTTPAPQNQPAEQPVEQEKPEQKNETQPSKPPKQEREDREDEREDDDREEEDD